MVYKARHIVIVNGYGCHLNTPLMPYLDRVVRFINEVPTDMVLQLIFTGGPTQQDSAPGVTEAHLMSEYVTKHPDRRRVQFMSLEEETAFTSYDNISKAAELIRNTAPDLGIEASWKYKSTKITIFCEATRSANVIMLARHFLLPFVKTIDDITVETASWERADPFKQVGNLIYNKLAITYPWLRLAEREHRQRMRKAKKK